MLIIILILMKEYLKYIKVERYQEGSYVPKGPCPSGILFNCSEDKKIAVSTGVKLACKPADAAIFSSEEFPMLLVWRSRARRYCSEFYMEEDKKRRRKINL